MPQPQTQSLRRNHKRFTRPAHRRNAAFGHVFGLGIFDDHAHFTGARKADVLHGERESPEARKAMRDLLDELDAEVAKPSTPPRSQAPAPRAPSPPRGLHFYGVKAFYEHNPSEHGWTFVSVTHKNRLLVFERQYRSAHVTLRYFWTTGTVQLVYPVERHPTNGDGQDTHKATWDDEEQEWVETPRRMQENFRGLEAIEFGRMLRNAPQWFGMGYLVA